MKLPYVSGMLLAAGSVVVILNWGPTKTYNVAVPSIEPAQFETVQLFSLSAPEQRTYAPATPHGSAVQWPEVKVPVKTGAKAKVKREPKPRSQIAAGRKSEATFLSTSGQPF